MRVKHSDIIIDKKVPFSNCKLGREPYAKILTDIVNTYNDGFVLAINNEWGTGKTTFVKMWQQYLKNKEFKTIYFNAWENDFDYNALVAIMSEFKSLSNTLNKEKFKSVLQKGAVLSKNILPALAKALAQRYIDVDVLVETIKGVTKATTEILEDEIKEFANKKESIQGFRDALTEFTETTTENKPLVFIIDELDRCKPSYAVEVLEQIKHLFSVKGIVFVLSIDKTQLGYAIKGVYGNDNINSDEYLRRFIDLEYSIPAPSNEAFCEYLYSYYNFDEFFGSTARRQINKFDYDKSMFLKMATMIFDKSNPTLRQQEKIFGLTRLILGTFNEKKYIFPHLFFFLIYLKAMNPHLYSRIQTNNISLQDLSDEFANLVPFDTIPNGLNLLYVEAELLTFYNNGQEDRKELLTKNEKGEDVSIIKSKTEPHAKLSTLTQCLQKVASDSNYCHTELSYLLKKISLMEPLKQNS